MLRRSTSSEVSKKSASARFNCLSKECDRGVSCRRTRNETAMRFASTSSPRSYASQLFRRSRHCVWYCSSISCRLRVRRGRVRSESQIDGGHLTTCVSAAGPAEARAYPRKTTARGPRREAPTAANAGYAPAGEEVPACRACVHERPRIITVSGARGIASRLVLPEHLRPRRSVRPARVQSPVALQAA